MPSTHNYDIFIIGSGAAGLALALTLADNANIAIISKDDLLAGASQYAQGGIAAVMEQTDQAINAHIQDTLKTGGGLCDPGVVAFVVKQAKHAIEWLIGHGVQFTIDPNAKQFHVTQEGGHSERRILHAADRTGAAIVQTLIEQVFAHPNIHCFSQHTAIDLIRQEGQCIGAHVFDNNTGQINTFYAKETILACGGGSSVYRHTTNPDFTSGDGIAMAQRAGCSLQNMEFNQFHPTCLYYSGQRPFLISEALRGEGAKLILPNGKRFIDQYDARAELAPRDIVARAIHNELQKNHIDHVYLDITHLPNKKIQTYFPTIYDYCYQQGIDITHQPIPVVPAAHYTCGGVVTNLNAQTKIPHLYAIGEVACTGLHGANRMASNSLLECLVFAASASKAIVQSLKNHDCQTPKKLAYLQYQAAITDFDVDEKISALRQLMWEDVGIVRNNQGLQRAKLSIEKAADEINRVFSSVTTTRKLIEYRNLISTAYLIVNAAIVRTDNLGLHYNADIKNKVNLL